MQVLCSEKNSTRAVLFRETSDVLYPQFNWRLNGVILFPHGINTSSVLPMYQNPSYFINNPHSVVSWQRCAHCTKGSTCVFCSSNSQQNKTITQKQNKKETQMESRSEEIGDPTSTECTEVSDKRTPQDCCCCCCSVDSPVSWLLYRDRTRRDPILPNPRGIEPVPPSHTHWR